jgi:HAD superfamily hydrolase (TIGR01509 family)
MKQVVLFDFHNTLATCDAWLELEIKSLPALVLEDLANRELIGPRSTQDRVRVTELFRQLRQGVHESGREVSAVEGVLEVFGQMGVEASRDDVDRVVADLERSLLPTVEVIRGVEGALERLRDAGCSLGVVSSAGYPQFVELALENSGLRPYFGTVLTSAGEGIYKSNPEIYRRAVARLGASPSGAVHVGDHPAFDVRAAKAAGLSTVWFVAQAMRTAAIRGEVWARQSEADPGADAVVSDMEMLFDAIARL